MVAAGRAPRAYACTGTSCRAPAETVDQWRATLAALGPAEDSEPGPSTRPSAQRQAIEAPLGPVLVVAGPGAGKTFCLIARIAQLIAWPALAGAGSAPSPSPTRPPTRSPPGSSGRSARAAEDVTRGTLHALCFGLLRDHAAAAGLRRGFGIADDDYQRRVLRRLRVRPERQGRSCCCSAGTGCSTRR